MKVTKEYLKQIIREEIQKESKAAAALALGGALGMGGIAAHHAGEMDKAITAKSDKHDVSKISPSTLKQGYHEATGKEFIGNKFELQKAILDFLEDEVIEYKQDPKTRRWQFYKKI